MPVIPVGYAQANYAFTGPGLPYGAEVTMGLGIGGYGGTPTEAAEDAYVAFSSTVLTRMASGVTLRSCSVKYGPSETGPTGLFTGSAVGGQAGSEASSAVSILVRKVTAMGGRAGRGRFYLPGLREGDVGSDGALSPAYVTVLQGECDEYLDALEANLLLPVLLHSAGAPITVPTTITALTVDSRVGTQRRRQRR